MSEREKLTDEERCDLDCEWPPNGRSLQKLLRIHDAQAEDLDLARKVLRLRAMAIEPSVYAALHRALHGRDQ